MNRRGMCVEAFLLWGNKPVVSVPSPARASGAISVGTAPTIAVCSLYAPSSVAMIVGRTPPNAGSRSPVKPSTT